MGNSHRGRINPPETLSGSAYRRNFPVISPERACKMASDVVKCRSGNRWKPSEAGSAENRKYGEAFAWR